MVLPVAKDAVRLQAGTDEILIVEDEQTARRALGLLLASCGYRPQTFRTAEEALVWLDGGFHPRTALVDLNLPGMDGLQFIRRLQRVSPQTYPVLVTATDEGTLARRLQDLPVSYLRKPINFDELLSLLRSLGR